MFGIKEGGERVADVTRIITQLKGDSTVTGGLFHYKQRLSIHSIDLNNSDAIANRK